MCKPPDLAHGRLNKHWSQPGPPPICRVDVADDSHKPKPDLQPEFRADLDSLFVHVDSRMAERRGAIAPASQEQFVGFGLEEGAGRPLGQRRATAAVDADLTLAIRSAVREAVDDLFRERLAAEVRAAVEDALRAAPPANREDAPRLRRSTLLSIRLRKTPA